MDGPLTRRQYITWLYWLGEDWETPTLTDYYLMQVACEVRRVLAKDPNKIRTNHFKLEFGSGKKRKSDKKTLTREQAAEKAKANWIAAIGATQGKAVIRDKDGNVVKKVGEKKPPLSREERRQAHREKLERVQRERQGGSGRRGTMHEKGD